MSSENPTYISDYNALLPDDDDLALEGAEYLRDIKSSLGNTFPNLVGAASATQTEFDILDGALVTTAELNILDGVTADKDEINVLDGVVAGTVTSLKALIAGASKTIDELTVTDLTATEMTAVLLKAASVIEDGVTGTTQAVQDDSTKLATTAYVDRLVQIEGNDKIANQNVTGSWATYLDQSITVTATTRLMIVADVHVWCGEGDSVSLRIAIDGVAYGVEMEGSSGNDDGNNRVLSNTTTITGLTAGARTVQAQVKGSSSADALNGAISIMAVE
ncbi:MAG: hypothetical protein GY746_07445 [Gammaproteobacteria bacterium]|nr:hypothetical protein [Gammaproteobacteria bacterium]